MEIAKNKIKSNWTRAELIKAKMELLQEEVNCLRKEYIEELANCQTVKEIKVKMFSCDVDVNPDEFNGWQCDWWGAEPVEIAGRMWNVFGSAWYGDIQYTEVKD